MRSVALLSKLYAFRVAWKLTSSMYLLEVSGSSRNALKMRKTVSVVLGLQTIGPALLTALKSQDQFLAAFVLMFVALLTLIGTMISDLLLALVDPRIRYE